MNLQRDRRSAGGVVSPEHLGESIARYDARGLAEQYRQDRTLLAASEVERRALHVDAQVAQYPKDNHPSHSTRRVARAICPYSAPGESDGGHLAAKSAVLYRRTLAGHGFRRIRPRARCSLSEP